MPKFRNKHRIESNRLNIWDYSNAWWYYVTICTKGKVNHFGKIENEKMVLNSVGKSAYKYWEEIPLHHKNTKLDLFVIMPNHIHGIIILDCRDVRSNVSTNFLKITYYSTIIELW